MKFILRSLYFIPPMPRVRPCSLRFITSFLILIALLSKLLMTDLLKTLAVEFYFFINAEPVIIGVIALLGTELFPSVSVRRIPSEFSLPEADLISPN